MYFLGWSRSRLQPRCHVVQGCGVHRIQSSMQIQELVSTGVWLLIWGVSLAHDSGEVDDFSRGDGCLALLHYGVQQGCMSHELIDKLFLLSYGDMPAKNLLVKTFQMPVALPGRQSVDKLVKLIAGSSFSNFMSEVPISSNKFPTNVLSLLVSMDPQINMEYLVSSQRLIFEASAK